MMKQWSAVVLVVTLLGHGVAYAQPEGQQYRDPKACHELQAQGKITPWPAVCEYVPVPVTKAQEKKQAKKLAKAQEEQEKRALEQHNACSICNRPFSPRLKMVGIVTTVIGGIMMIPQGDTYHIFGESVCVNGNSIDEGSCGNRTLIGIGALTAAAGITMFAVGNIKIKPKVTAKQKSVSVAFTW